MKREKIGPTVLIGAGVVLAALSTAVLAGALQPQPAPPELAQPTASSAPAPQASAVATPTPGPSGSPSAIPDATEPAPADPASVSGAYEAAGYWWVPCDSPHAIQPQEFEYGCSIEGHAPAAGTLLAPETQPPAASPSDVELGVRLLEAWIPYDSAAPEQWTSAVARAAPSGLLPQAPSLAWSTKAGDFADEGFHAVVELEGEPQLIATTVEADGAHLSYSAPVAATYSIERSCLPDDATSNDHCTLVEISEPLLWTLVVRDGQIVELLEPDPFSAR